MGGTAGLNGEGRPHAEMTGTPRCSMPSASARSNLMLCHPIESQPNEGPIAMGAHQRRASTSNHVTL